MLLDGSGMYCEVAEIWHPLCLVHPSFLVEARVTARKFLVAASLECGSCFRLSEELCSESVSQKQVAFASTLARAKILKIAA